MSLARKAGEVFVEVRAQVEVDQDLQKAERSFAKLADYVKKNPVAVMGALGAAAVSVAVQATRMAHEVDSALKGVERSVDGAKGKMGQLLDTIREMSTNGIHSQVELGRAASAIATGGVESMEGLEKRLRAVALAADATGGDMTQIAGGLDQVLDLFGMSSDQSEEVVQKLFAASRGKLPMQDLLDAFQTAAPKIRKLGIDFDTSAGAMAALLDQGLSAKQAASELAMYGEAGKVGAEQIKLLAAQSRDLTKAQGEMNAAAQVTRESIEGSFAQTKNNFVAVMIDLGQIILPKVETGLKAIVGLIQTISGTVGDIGRGAAFSTLRELGKRADELNAADRERLKNAAREVENTLIRRDVSQLQGWSIEDLRALKAGLNEVGMAGPARTTAIDNLIKAKWELAKVNKAVTTTETDGILTGEHALAQSKKREEEDNKAKKRRDEEIKWGKALGVALVDLRKKAEEADAASMASIGEEITRQTVALTETLVDDITLQYEKMIAAADTMASRGVEGAAEYAKQLRTLRDNAIDVAEHTRLVAKGTAELNDELKPLGLTIENVGNAGVSSNNTQKEGNELLRERARTIMDAVNGALQLAEAFGLVDQQTLNVVRSIGQVAANLGPLSEALSADKLKAGDVISSALPVIGGIASIVSSFSAARAQSKQALALVDDQLDALNDSFEQFTRSFAPAVTAFGEEMQRIADFVRESSEQIDGMLTSTARRALAAAGGDAEAALADLRRRDLDPNVNLGPAIKQLEAYIAATKDLAEAQKLAREEAERARVQRVADLQADIRERLLRAEGRDAEADAAARARRYDEERKAAIHAGADVITLAMLATVQAIEEAAILAAQAADAAMQQARDRRTQLGQRWEVFDITDTRQQFDELLAFYGSIFPEIASILDGIDLSTPEGLDQFNGRLKDLFLSLDPENLPEGMTREMFDALVAALLELEGIADDVAAGIETASQKMASALSRLETDFEVFGTDALGRARGIADLYGFSDLDLSTEEGRKKAEEYLQQLYNENKDDPEMVSGILAVLRAIRGVPGAEAPSAGAGVSGGAVSRSSASSGTVTSFTGASMQQTDRLLGLTGTLVDLTREQLMFDRLMAQALTRPGTGLVPPQLTQSFGTSGDISVTFSGGITVNVAAGAPANARVIASTLAKEIMKEVERELARNLQNSRRRLGENTTT